MELYDDPRFQPLAKHVLESQVYRVANQVTHRLRNKVQCGCECSAALAIGTVAGQRGVSR